MNSKWKARHYGTVNYFRKITWHNLTSPSRQKNSRAAVLITQAEFDRFCKKFSGLIEKYYMLNENPTLKRIDPNRPWEAGNIAVVPRRLAGKNLSLLRYRTESSVLSPPAFPELSSAPKPKRNQRVSRTQPVPPTTFVWRLIRGLFGRK